VVVIDLDGLKLANDTRGHDLGDRLLRSLAAVVRGCVRAQDVVARLGGDEIGVLMTATDEERCREVAARIANAISEHPGVDGFPLSAAVGHATRAAAADVTDAVRSADMRMYLHKRARGRPVLAVAEPVAAAHAAR
jgi:diguanylate cyclase (GGDEF)-like protein